MILNQIDSIGIDMSFTALEKACIKHWDAMQCSPTTIVCSIEDALLAYEILARFPSIPRLTIVPVPGFPPNMWIVCSAEYAVYSEGAG